MLRFLLSNVTTSISIFAPLLYTTGRAPGSPLVNSDSSVVYKYDGLNTSMGSMLGQRGLVHTQSYYVERDTALNDKVCFSVADSALILLDCFAEYPRTVLTGTSGPSELIQTVPLSSSGPLLVDDGPILASATLPSLDDSAIAVAYQRTNNLSIAMVPPRFLQLLDLPLCFSSYRICFKVDLRSTQVKKSWVKLSTSSLFVSERALVSLTQFRSASQLNWYYAAAAAYHDDINMQIAMTILYEPGFGTDSFKFVVSPLNGAPQSFALKPSLSSNSTKFYGIITTNTPQISITNLATVAINNFNLSYLPQGTQSILWARTTVASTRDVACVEIATNTTDVVRAIYAIYCFDFIAIPFNVSMTPYYVVTANTGRAILSSEIFFDDQDQFCFSVRGNTFLNAHCAPLSFTGTTGMADLVAPSTSVTGNVTASVTISRGGNFVTVSSMGTASGSPLLQVNAFMKGSPPVTYETSIALTAPNLASLTAAFSPDFERCYIFAPCPR